jgi:hypothetical protein
MLSKMWSAHEVARQRRLDSRTQATNSEQDWLAADAYFNQVARRYDRFTQEASIEFLAEIIIDAIETHRHYADLYPKFSRRYIDEAAYQRWSKAEAAKSFFASPSFAWLVSFFAMTPHLP